MKQYAKKLLVSVGLLSMLALPVAAMAGTTADEAANFFGINGVGNGNTANIAGEAGFETTDVRITIARIIRGLMGFLGIVAVVIVLLGGFRWMTAQGDQEKVKSAQQLLIAGLIGLIIITLAFAITQFVFTQLVAESVNPATS